MEVVDCIHMRIEAGGRRAVTSTKTLCVKYAKARQDDTSRLIVVIALCAAIPALIILLREDL
jgi:hypothetical protein